MKSLRTAVGEVKLKTPFLLGSGFITETPAFFLQSRQFGCAGMVTRSLKEHVPKERSRVPAPRYAVFGDSMLNCEWGNEKPWTDWRDTGIAAVKKCDSAIILSLSGRDIQSCINLMRVFNKHPVDAFEVNISCSHSGALHGNLNVDTEHLCSLLKHIRPVTQKPIWIKLSYSPFIVEMAGQAEELGADAIVLTNSIGPGLLIDVPTGKPKIGIQGGAGGVTGAAIFPIALRCVYEVSKAVSVPVVGVGGIMSSNEAIQMIMAGASAVQVYTLPTLRGPQSFRELVTGTQEFLDASTFGSVSEFRGIAHKERLEHSFRAQPPNVNPDTCTGCGICIPSCAFDAIKLARGTRDKPVAVIKHNCIGCNACVGVCPPAIGAITTTF